MDEIRRRIAEQNSYFHEGWTELHWACVLTLPECVKILVAAGADINARTRDGSTPLMMIRHAHQSSYECIKLLVDAGANVNITNKWGWSSLHLACLCNPQYIQDIYVYIEGVKLLIAAGIDLNIKAYKEPTPLHIACLENNTHLVQVLLESGADVSITAYNGKLPRDLTNSEEIKDIIEGFGGGRLTKEATH